MKKDCPDERGLLDMFRRDVDKFSILSREEERAIAEKARSGDQATRDRLVEANLRALPKTIFFEIP